jgi:opine dehydrogenase
MRVAVLGAGAGGAAAVAELSAAGHEVSFWGRSRATLASFETQGGVAYEGVLGSGLATPKLMTTDLAAALAGADAALVCLPTFAHDDVARRMAIAGITAVPVVLNPGHTGGALEFRQTIVSEGAKSPPIAEFATLTHVARKYRPDCVTITGAAKRVRAAALPSGRPALDAARALFASAAAMPDVLACDLANVNMVLHAPGAVLAAAWVEATHGDFTFYRQAMTPGVARVMRALDAERCSVARVFGHELPPVVAEMQSIGTVEPGIRDVEDLVAAIASGEANRRIKGPDSLEHRYYREDFGYGLLPFVVFARIAGIDVPVASALLTIGATLIGSDVIARGRTAAKMGVAGLDRHGLLALVRGNADGG